MARDEKYQRLKIFQEPFWLINTDKEGSFHINEEALREIKMINVSLIIVAIVGLYRTGKSYLMNCLAERNKGFPLGNTVQAKTKGIWGLCKEHPSDQRNEVILLLDTEGLGDAARGDTGHDKRLFTLATLLCNVLVYNIKCVFDQDAIDKLTFITEISKRILFKNKFKSHKDKDEKQFELILPTFVLCLRDFQLSLEKDGEEMTPNQYMQDCLKLKPGNDEYTKKFNKPRESILSYFPTRQCFVFDRPGGRNVMQRLETAKPEELSPSFREDTQNFIRYIHECRPKVLLSSKPVNGTMFASLAGTYVKAIQNGAVPDVDDAIDTAARMENGRLAKEAVEIFKTRIEVIKLPILHTATFDELYHEAKKYVLEKFRLEAVFDAKKHEEYLTTEMDKIWEKVKKDNHRHVRSYCDEELQKMYRESVGENRKNNRYNVSGGYLLYKTDMGTLKKNFKEKMEGTDHTDVLEVLHKFMEKEADVEGAILMQDQKLTADDVQREMDRIHKENKEAQKEIQESFDSRLKEEKERAEQYNKQMDAERKEYMAREEEKLRMMQSQWQEQKNLTEKQLQAMKEENDSIKHEMKEYQSNAEKTRQSLEDKLQKEKDENAEREKKLKDEFTTLVKENNQTKNNQQSRSDSPKIVHIHFGRPQPDNECIIS